MKKQIFTIITLIGLTSGLVAQSFNDYVKSTINYKTENGEEFVQRDLTSYVLAITEGTDAEQFQNTDQALWVKYANAWHPTVKTLNVYFESAANEFGVPVDLLKAIGQVENNWMQIGPSMDRGWGIMHLVENEYCSTLKDAAKLLNSDIEILKNNPKENIRGAAALLAYYAGDNSSEFEKMEDWFEAVKKFTGLIDEDLQELQAENYYNVLKDGKIEMTVWNEYIILENHPEINIEDLLVYKEIRENSKAVDYPGAISQLTTCNYSSRNGTDIDTWVNHYIGTGTIAGALSWFKNCSSQVSAHFCLSVNGTLYQSVNISNKAWHAGASGYNNNERSIGIEHDVTTSTPNNWNNTTMLTKSADVARYFCNQQAIPKTRSLPGIRGHNEMPGTNTSCPGNLPWTTWMNLLNQTSTSPPTPTAPTSGQTGVTIPVYFAWTSTLTGTDFRIQVSTSNSGWTATNGFTTGTTPTSTVVVNYNTGTTKSYSWASGSTGSYTGPQFGTTYYWTVRQYSASTGTSQYSAVRSFTVKNQTIIALDNFDVNSGHFNTIPTYSGTTVGIATTSTWGRVTDLPQAGAGCMRGILNDDPSNTTNWKIRLLSGGGTPANNVSVSKSGKISFWMKTSTANTGATVYVWIDDSDGTEQSIAKSIYNDGVWHLYEFDLTNFQGSAVTGNGVINGPNVTLDAIMLSRNHSTTNWYFWIDEVKYTGFTKSDLASEETIIENNTRIYPNPVIDMLNIDYELNDSKAILSVIDMTGKSVLTAELEENNTEIDVSDLPSGIYILNISSELDNFNKQIIKY
jgi:hypothetical protein